MKNTQNAGTTYFVLILDESGSMTGFTNQVRELLTQKFKDMSKEAKRTGQKVKASLIKFGNKPTLISLNTSLNELVEQDKSEIYAPRHEQTALWDGVGLAIENLQNVKLTPNDAVLVEVITDGEENHSQNWQTDNYLNIGLSHTKNLKTEINRLMNTDQWTFVFQVPRGHKNILVNTFGLSSDNVQEWETTAQGLEQISHYTTLGYINYMTGREAGATSTKKFFAKTDLSTLKPTVLKKELDDVTDQFKIFEVNKEEAIQDFVEKKTGREYVVGAAKYQLSKKELIREGRDLFIMEKGKNRVWGGDAARKLLGLPETGEVEVTPYNHSIYEIFTTSTSRNRKLVRGTKVLVDMSKKKGDKTTWGTN